ncbi:carbohydrate sulfotransferase 8-like [Littorina saxatilis]|uniref:carbohydrate sulfotransferase 8-like n=1 Tax=Littorina saxatilis TaxID=31220 RepID=UPI0038B427DD
MALPMVNLETNRMNGGLLAPIKTIRMCRKLYRRCTFVGLSVTLLLGTSYLLFYAGPFSFHNSLQFPDKAARQTRKPEQTRDLADTPKTPGSAIQSPIHSGKNPARNPAADKAATPPATVTPTPPFPASPAELFRTRDLSGEDPELLNELYERARRADEVCRQDHAGNKQGRVTGLFTHEASRVAYCFLPKAGCTFWIRVFSYLHNFTGDVVDSPWKIPRLKVHQNRHSHGVGWAEVKKAAESYLRFMFVRHPFSRLWSAYLDKLFLPDFWSEIGVPAVRRLRGKNATAHALKCGSDLTFPEFVEHSLTTYEPHWEPIYLRCDPCQYRPAVVGSMKTFARDSLFLLRQMGLEWVLKDLDRDDQEEKELATLVEYNFNRIRSLKFYQRCVNDDQLASLLWKTFQKNGYIPKNVSYHQHNTNASSQSSANFSVSDFRDRVMKTFRASLPLQGELKKQKKAFLRDAFDSLPYGLMKKVKKKYERDMLFFGFDEENY